MIPSVWMDDYIEADWFWFSDTFYHNSLLASVNHLEPFPLPSDRKYDLSFNFPTTSTKLNFFFLALVYMHYTNKMENMCTYMHGSQFKLRLLNWFNCTIFHNLQLIQQILQEQVLAPSLLRSQSMIQSLGWTLKYPSPQFFLLWHTHLKKYIFNI